VLESGPIDWDTKIRYAAEVAAGMEYLHGLDRIHRDLKSSNLLVSRNNRVKVADFGTAAKVLRREQISARKKVKRKREALSTLATHSSNSMIGAIGTPLWMAPEMLAGDRYGKAVDLYSFGVVMYEIGTQHKPWLELKSSQLFAAVLASVIRTGRRPARDARVEWPENFVTVMERAWSTVPASRGTFSEAREALGYSLEKLFSSFQLRPAGDSAGDTGYALQDSAAHGAKQEAEQWSVVTASGGLQLVDENDAAPLLPNEEARL
jgi:serine/threonine protein kinase